MTASSPRLSATLVLVRETPEGMQVFMQVRSSRMSFAAGSLVFPGGSLDEGDLRLAAAGRALVDADARGLGEEELALRVAAIREVFEESGLLLATRGGEALSAEEAERLSAIYLDKEAGFEGRFDAFLEQEGLQLAASALTRFAHWVTPEGLRKRFDTHFFLARAPEHEGGGHDGHEAVDSHWISPEAAVAAAEAGTFQLMFPTRLNLLMLARAGSLAGLADSVARSGVVTVRPEFVTLDGQSYLRIPEEAGYGGPLFPAGLVPESERAPRQG